VINAEKAAYMAPEFETRRVGTLKNLLQHIHKKYKNTVKKSTSFVKLLILKHSNFFIFKSLKTFGIIFSSSK